MALISLLVAFCALRKSTFGDPPNIELRAAQIRVAWFPDAPEPRIKHKKQTRQISRDLVRSKKLKVRTAQKVAEAKRTLNSIQKAASSTKPSQALIETFLTCKNPLGTPIDGLKLNVRFLNVEGRLLRKETVSTGSEGPGEVEVKTSQYPVIVDLNFDNSHWNLANSTQGIFALKGNEGSQLNLQARPSLNASLEPVAIGSDLIVRRIYKAPDLVVERNVGNVVISTDPDTEVYLGNLDIGKSDTTGNLKTVVPVNLVGRNGGFLTFKRNTGFATFRGSTKIGPIDPYHVTTITASTRLEEINALNVIGINFPNSGLMLASDVQNQFGRPDAKRASQSENRVGDGATWWWYGDKGLAFRVRKVLGPDLKNELVIERIRITSPAGGSVGGVSVGQSVSEMRFSLGTGQSDENVGDFSLTSFLGGGVVIATNANKVAWIDIMRPAETISNDVDMQVPSLATKVYCQNISDRSGHFQDGPQMLQDWLSKLPGIEIVASEAQANIDLQASIDQCTVQNDKLLKTIPMRSTTTVSLSYKFQTPLEQSDATDADSAPLTGGSVQATETADYEKDVKGGATELGIINVGAGLIKDSKARSLVQLLAGVSTAGAISNMAKTMSHAQTRSREIALENCARIIFNQLSDVCSIRIRVSDIDYSSGRFTLNAGQVAGIQPGMEFELFNGSVPAFNKILTPIRESQVIARVVEVSKNTSICELFKEDAQVDTKAFAHSKETVYPQGLTKLLAASTGMVQAQRLMRISWNDGK